KIRKGKQEQYLKDEEELAQYQIQNALDGASLHVNAEAPGISGSALESIVTEYRKVQGIIKRLSRNYSPDVLNELVDLHALAEENLRDEQAVRAWVTELEEAVSKNSRSGAIYAFSVKFDEDEGAWLPVITSTIHGITRKVVLGTEFFKSLEYNDIRSLGD